MENKLCPECRKKFLLAEKVVQNKKSHDKREFPCNICGKTLAGKTNYYNHENQHETFKCNVCKKNFQKIQSQSIQKIFNPTIAGGGWNPPVEFLQAHREIFFIYNILFFGLTLSLHMLTTYLYQKKDQNPTGGPAGGV